MARVARPEDVAQMRRRLLRAAYTAIAEQGFAEVTLADMAAQAGVSKSLVLYYFKDKETVLTAAMEWVDAIISKRARQAIADAEADGPRAQLEAHLAALTLGAREHREFYHVYLDFLSAGLRNTEARRSALRFIEGCEELERKVVARGIAEGVFRRDLDSVEAADVVRGLIDGMSVQWVFHDEEPFEEFRGRLRRAIFGYLGAAA